MKLNTKKCKLCGLEFAYVHNAQTVCNNKHYKTCEVCGNEFEYDVSTQYQTRCSTKCTQQKREATMLDRYGARVTTQSPALLAKIIQSNIAKFGVEHPAQSQEIKDRMKSTCQANYGIDSPFQMHDFWDKAKQTNRAKYGTDHLLQNSNCIERMQANYTKTCMERFGVPYACMTDNCVNKNPGDISAINRYIGAQFEAAGLDVKFEKHIEDRSYDIELLNTATVVEINPTYTHNLVGNHWTLEGSDKNYHLQKSLLAEKHNYRCIHIFDWDDISKIVEMLKPKQTIYARNCVCREIDTFTADTFINKYHLQGKCRNTKKCFGLYYAGELIEVMTFGRPRYTKKYQ